MENCYDNQNNILNANAFFRGPRPAKLISSRWMMRKQMESYDILGKRIRDIRFIGKCLNLDRSQMICSIPYGSLLRGRNVWQSIRDEQLFRRSASIMEPVLIRLGDEDGKEEILELLATGLSEFRIDRNRIPWDTPAVIEGPNMSARRLFSNCIGKTVIDIRYNCGITGNVSNGCDALDPERLKNFAICLSGGLSLLIDYVSDRCEVSCVSARGTVQKIAFRELKKGLSNPEDLHIDGTTGIRCNRTFFFGDKGKEYLGERPYVAISGKKGTYRLQIALEDFDMFSWCIRHIFGSFDRDMDYEMSCGDFRNILCEAEGILSVYCPESGQPAGCSTEENPGLFFDPFRESSTGDRYLFMRNMEKYRLQLRDIRKWTDKAFGEEEMISVAYGRK